VLFEVMAHGTVIHALNQLLSICALGFKICYTPTNTLDVFVTNRPGLLESYGVVDGTKLQSGTDN